MDTSKKLMGSGDCRLSSVRNVWLKTAIGSRWKELNSSTCRASGCAAAEDTNARFSQTIQKSQRRNDITAPSAIAHQVGGRRRAGPRRPAEVNRLTR